MLSSVIHECFQAVSAGAARGESFRVSTVRDRADGEAERFYLLS